jgi:hypothetical protein
MKGRLTAEELKQEYSEAQQPCWIYFEKGWKPAWGGSKD